MTKRSLAIYSAAHFWVDLSCAFLLFRTLSGSPQWMLCLLLYNFCAFALQMPLGLLADRWNRNGLTAAAGCVLTALACLSPVPLLTAVTAGVGNALFHLGVFISPGAVGLYIGTIWGQSAGPWLGLAPLGPLLMAALIHCPKTDRTLRSGNATPDLAAPQGYGVLLPLFLVVVLRSYMGMNQSFPWKGRWALVLTLALALGKTAGGFLMDSLGPRRASNASLGLAAALYLASALPLPGTLAVFLFNMTMPVTLWAAARALPGAKGFAFGLLTFALFLGYLPAYLGWPSLLTGPAAYACAALLSLVILWFGLGKEAKPCLQC